jgi:hypothetical protein
MFVTIPLIIRKLQKKSHGKMTKNDFIFTITINELIMIFAFVIILRFVSKMMGMRMAL